jgi:hypothetical protein
MGLEDLHEVLGGQRTAAISPLILALAQTFLE